MKSILCFTLLNLFVNVIFSQAPTSREVPIGSVVAFAGNINNLPKDWLICDGTAHSQKELGDLFKIIGTIWGNGDGNPGSFNLPDMRGYFLRGVDSGSGRDIDAPNRKSQHNGGNMGDTVGTWQDDIVGKHNHSGDRLGSDAETGAGKRLYAGHGNNVVAIPETNNYGTGMGNETRPKNVSIYYIIKVR